MKNFYRSTTFTLMILISTFVGFAGSVLEKVEVEKFMPYLSIKTFLMLSVALLICAIPDLITILIKRGKTDE
ncbi:hypothetical protein [Enterococcus mundtii]|uniref:hypothetical protein n=1 Tax=Enterococcus mundtii TaxID=53346 RepID=UPI000DF8C767|nr:hypothetical protein [Enterococcus mundtii]STD27439.1 Uncharacterised protein [Enterococcus mundtii]